MSSNKKRTEKERELIQRIVSVIIVEYIDGVIKDTIKTELKKNKKKYN